MQGRVLQREGYITRVRKNAVQVLVPAFGLEGPVYLDVLNEGEGAPELEYDTEAMTLNVVTTKEVCCATQHRLGCVDPKPCRQPYFASLIE